MKAREEKNPNEQEESILIIKGCHLTNPSATEREMSQHLRRKEK